MIYLLIIINIINKSSWLRKWQNITKLSQILEIKFLLLLLLNLGQCAWTVPHILLLINYQ